CRRGGGGRERLDQGCLYPSREPRPLVEDRNPGLAVRLAPVDRDRGRRGGVVERVLDQVVEHDRDVFVRCLREGVAVTREEELSSALGGTRLPALAGALGRIRQRERTRRAWLAAFAREGQQGRQEPR